MIDVNAFTNDVKTQILGWLSSIGTNLVCPIITAAAIIYCIFQLPQLFKAHRDGMSDVFWEFMWKEIIGLVVAVGTSVLWAFWPRECSAPRLNPLYTKICCPDCVKPGSRLFFHWGQKNASNWKIHPKPHSRQYRNFNTQYFSCAFDGHNGLCK